MRPILQPLTESELDRLERLLATVNPGRVMTLPEIDGYFCALVAGPNREPMADRLNPVLGHDFSNGLPFYNVQKEAGEARKLLERLWETVAAAFPSGQPYIPHFDLDDEGRQAGKEWAEGFARGMNRDPFLWDAFLLDKKNANIVALLGILVAEARPRIAPGGIGPVIPPERRAELLAGIVACLTQIFRHFHPSGRMAEPWIPTASQAAPRRNSARWPSPPRFR